MSSLSRLPTTASALRLMEHGWDNLRAFSVQSNGRPELIFLDLLRNVVFLVFIFRYTRRIWRHIYGHGPLGALTNLYTSVRCAVYGLVLRAPGVRSQVRKQVAESIGALQARLVATPLTRHTRLPQEGWEVEQVRKELDALAGLDHTRWEEGYVSGAVYHGGEELVRLQTEAWRRFAVANPIHPDVFPGVRKMEAEVVAMVLALFNAPDGAAGATTAGGTESILMACYAARQKAYMERGVTEPEIILPETAHTAFRKACDYFKIKMHLVDCPAPSYQVDVWRVARLINGNTVLLVGSAPNFPHGIMDDIGALSRLALKKWLPLHVDCCLGSFVVPFLAKAGFDAPLFDFRLPGVTSISCDTHKYGFAPKGNSTILYRFEAMRTYQYYISPDWSGGVYASPGMAGSRPGALISGCWASMMALGEAGYLDACKQIVGTAKQIIDFVTTNPAMAAELDVMGRPMSSVVAVRAKALNIYDITDALTARGWHLNALQNPPAMHIAVTLPLVKAWPRLQADLEAVVKEEREKERARIALGKPAKGPAGSGSAALYGVAGSLPNKSVVVDLARGFLDTLYKA